MSLYKIVPKQATGSYNEKYAAESRTIQHNDLPSSSGLNIFVIFSVGITVDTE